MTRVKLVWSHRLRGSIMGRSRLGAGRQTMKATPLLIRDILGRYPKTMPVSKECIRDVAVLEDDLPAILDRNAAGHVLSRSTYVTEVKRETHDDN